MCSVTTVQQFVTYYLFTFLLCCYQFDREQSGCCWTERFILSIQIYFSAFPFILLGYFLRLWPLYSIFFHHFLVGLPAYFSNHSPFFREHNFVGFNKFPSLMCWCTVIHHHRPQKPTLFQRDGILLVCSVMCAQTRDLLF